MVSVSDPGSVLFGRTRQAILALLFTRPDESFYFREIVRRTGCGVGAVQRELSQLTNCGLVRRLREKYFQANPDSAIYQPLKEIVVRTIGLADGLRASLKPVIDRVAVAFIFGSFVRGEQRLSSDVDVMIITRGDNLPGDEIADLLRPQQERVGREINCFVLSAREFRAKWCARNHFIRSTFTSEKVFLIGDADELERLAEERVVEKPSDKPAGNQRTARAGRPRSKRRGSQRVK
jgi:predicted nucleotidyltransferase